MLFFKIFRNVLAHEVVDVARAHVPIRALYEDLGVRLCKINQGHRRVAMPDIYEARHLTLHVLQFIPFLVRVAQSNGCAVTDNLQGPDAGYGGGIDVGEPLGSCEVVRHRVDDVGRATLLFAKLIIDLRQKECHDLLWRDRHHLLITIDFQRKPYSIITLRRAQPCAPRDLFPFAPRIHNVVRHKLLFDF